MSILNLIVILFFVNPLWASKILQNQFLSGNLVKEDVTIEALPRLQEICEKEKYDIKTQSDLNSLLNTCQKVSGSILISNEYQEPSVNFGNLQSIEGDLKICDTKSVMNIIAPSLRKIGGEFKVRNLTSLVSLDIASIEDLNVVGWEIVPLLNNIVLNAGSTKMNKLIISDSALPNVNCIKKIKNINYLGINNNRFLENIDLDMEMVNDKLDIYSNAQDTSIQLSKLESVGDLSIRNSKTVNFPNLKHVNKSLDIIENYFTDLKLEELKKVSGTVGIIDNNNLKNVNMKNIEFIDGGLLIINNTKVSSINFLPNIKTIGGALQIEGDFNETEFPQLKLIKGSATFASQSDKFDCDKWIKPVNERSIIRGGKIKCSTKKKNEYREINQDGKILEENSNKTSSATRARLSTDSNISDSQEIKTANHISSTTTERKREKTNGPESSKKKNGSFKIVRLSSNFLYCWILFTLISSIIL